MALTLELNIHLTDQIPEEVLKMLHTMRGVRVGVATPDHRFFHYLPIRWEYSLHGATLRLTKAGVYNMRYRGKVEWNEQDADRFAD